MITAGSASGPPSSRPTNPRSAMAPSPVSHSFRVSLSCRQAVISEVRPGRAAVNRWYGGMVHGLGHAFGLPDSAATDGTPMSASFCDYPNTHFNQSQKNQILNGPYGSFLS